MCENLQSVVITNIDRSSIPLANVLKYLLPFAGTLTRLTYSPNKYLIPRGRDRRDGWSEEKHACALLKCYQKLEYFEATTKICPDAFLTALQNSEISRKFEQPKKREWIIRLPRLGTCFTDSSDVSASVIPSPLPLVSLYILPLSS
jgi:hypothetical protein